MWVTLVELMSKGSQRLRDLPRALTLVWEAAHGWTVAWGVLLALQGVLPVALVWLTKVVVDSVVAAVKGHGSLRRPVELAVIAAFLLLLAAVLRALTRWVRTAQAELVRDHVAEMIQEKAVALDLGFYDSPEYHDRLHRVRQDAHSRPVALVESLGTMAQSTLTLVAMAAVLLRFGWWLPLALLGSTVPALGVVMRYALKQHDWWERTTEKQRRAWYYDWLLTDRTTAAEVRLLGTGGHFRTLYQHLRDGLRAERLDLARSEAIAEITAAGFALVVLGGGVAWMVWKAARGLVTLGDLAMFYQAFSQGQRLMRSLLETVGQIYSNSLFLGNLFEFLGLEPKLEEPRRHGESPIAEGPSLAFRGVTFRYPGSPDPVLDGFDLEIPGGRIAALVGDNGSGKSTLVKLACRLYDVEAGAVEVGGVDVRRIPVQALRAMMSVLFQEPVQYNETARKNIVLGDLEAPAEAARIEAAIDAVGARHIIGKLPGGLDTQLGRWFAGGVELSVGEWQRLALARAFFRKAPVILLDEPTAAMDAWSESEWINGLKQLVRGTTTLIITHRLTTASHADIIFLMRAGRIVESGAHEELLARGGPYADAWRRGTSG
ncbi:MAG: ABC transporter ATP-binding protein [Acidobacteria bacterium]|nr:ABC transporter ATP-binding protein [Acidobacteriota bacterium]